MSKTIAVTDECLKHFHDMKAKKFHSYILYTLSEDNAEVVVERTSCSLSWDDFLDDLPESEPRYINYDFQNNELEVGHQNTFAFIFWFVLIFAHLGG
ncbi:unnamed protein product [Aspergillus oryzae]|nr:unnamed protein product [Aspergillus oryzae]